MSWKFTERQPRTNNIATADSLNESYDSFKSGLNGNLSRDNIPQDSVDRRHLKDKAVHQVHLYDFSMTDGDHVNAANVLGPQGWTRDKFQGGWYQAIKQTPTLKEGMLHIELMGVAFYNNFECTVLATPPTQFGKIFSAQFKIHVNGVEVLTSPDYTHIIQPIHLVADVPISGGATEVEVFWTITPFNQAYADDRCEFYYGTMQLFLMNRYR
jgi:hypothetical protein